MFHLGLMICFLIQAASGLGRMFMQTSWGQGLCWIFGGYDAARTVHIYIGILLLCWFALHVLYVLAKINWKGFPGGLFGPDSLIPHPSDIQQAFQHLKWFLGLRKKPPEFDRWGYWEKFDYWAVFWGMAIIGVTGLVMAYPFASTRVIPGWGLNVAFWIHRIEAILAMAHIFIIHFFIGHLRRHNFPMDRAMFEGSVDLEAVQHERPSWIARLEQGGRLGETLVAESGSKLKIVYYLIGYTAICIGVFLLIGGLANSGRITW
jgi:cytochrome b subunit of formate dehydrogenase